MTAAGTHVVFGTGPAGRAVADALLGQGSRVRVANRAGAPVLTGVETIGGDATDVDFARDVAADAETRAAMSADLLDAHQRGDVREATTLEVAA